MTRLLVTTLHILLCLCTGHLSVADKTHQFNEILGAPVLMSHWNHHALTLQSDTIPNCPVHPVTNDLPSPLPQKILDALDSVEDQLSATVNSTSLPGIAYSVTYKGIVLKNGGVGVKVKGNSAPPDSNSIFRIGSVSKVFAVLTLFQMVARGQVGSLDDLLVTYCPEFSMLTEYNITLKQLASQLSGLPREAPCGPPDQLNICPLTTSQILQALKTERLVHPPWTRPSYSNLAYALIGNCLVEHFYSSLTYDQYVQKFILAPLGMTQTGFTYTTSVQEMMAVGYNVDGTQAVLADLGWESPAGQMYSSIRDLDTFARFFMSNDSSTQDNLLLPSSLRKEMQIQLYTNRDGLTGFGMPWEIRFQSNYTVLRKGGNVGGYSALFSFVPELQLSFNVLFSGAAAEFNVSNEAYDILIPAMVETLMTIQQPYPYPPDPETYEGLYTIEGAKINVSISTFQNQLLMIGLYNVYLAYREPLTFQVGYSDGVQPCLTEELLALQGQWLYFEKPVSGKSPSFRFPGIFNNIVFKRIQ